MKDHNFFHHPSLYGQCFFKSILFDSLSTEDIKLIDSVKSEKIFKKGQIVCNEGDEIHEFYHLKHGLVKIYTSDRSGREHIVSIAKPFDFIGFFTSFSESHYQYSIAAIEDSCFCIFDLEAIKNLIKTNSKFAYSLIENMSKVSDHIIRTKIELDSKMLKGRIAYIILYFAEFVYKNHIFEFPLSRKEIADLISMTTENVIRTLSEFRKDHIIEIEGKQIKIINMEMLNKIKNAG